MKNTQIQWTDHTWNIAVGCTKVDEDCKYCYMYRGSLDSTRYDPKIVRKTKTVFNLPLTIKEPSKIFTSSLTDVFHEDCDSFRGEMWDIIRQCPQHTFQVLTKRTDRIYENTPIEILKSKNVWIGTSIGSQNSIQRLYDLIVPIAEGKRFLSLEPLHGEIFLPFDEFVDQGHKVKDLIDWVIIGGESGNDNGQYKYRPCKIEWIESLIQQCKSANVPVFVKQLGTHLAKELKLKDRHGGNMEEWPEHLRIREFPELAPTINP